MRRARAPRQQVRVVLDVEEDHSPCRAARRPGEQVERVGGVAREDTTTSSARAPTKRATVSRAPLVQRGADLRRRCPRRGARCRTAAAPRSRVGDRPQRRRGGGVVEVDVATGGRRRAAPGGRRPRRAAAGEPRRGWTGMHTSGGKGPSGSALAQQVAAARSSPGAPHRDGGLPASKPGLRAGTRDLTTTVRATLDALNDPGARSRIARRILDGCLRAPRSSRNSRRTPTSASPT